VALWLSRKHDVRGTVRSTGKHEFFAVVSVPVRTGKFVFDMARWMSRDHGVMIVCCRSLCNTRRVNTRQARGRVQPTDGTVTGFRWLSTYFLTKMTNRNGKPDHSGAYISPARMTSTIEQHPRDHGREVALRR